MSISDLGTFLEAYGWPLLLTAGAGYVAYQYFKPASRGRMFGFQTPSSLLITQIEETYQHHPRFLRGTLNEAVEEAKRTGKILMVYIHDQDPRNNSFDLPSHRFFTSLLGTQFISEVLQENFICWAAVNNTAESSQIRRALNVTTAPFLAALNLTRASSSSRHVLVQLWRLMDPNISVEDLLVQLVDIVERREVLATQQAEEESKRMTSLEINRMLVQEQDREYQAALDADRLEQEKKKTRA